MTKPNVLQFLHERRYRFAYNERLKAYDIYDGEHWIAILHSETVAEQVCRELNRMKEEVRQCLGNNMDGKPSSISDA